MRSTLIVSLSILAAACSAPAQDEVSGQEAAAGSGVTMLEEQHLAHIADAAQLAGEIETCELEWQPYYFEYMQSERRRASNEGVERGSEAYVQRIAFVGVLFGAYQQQALDQSDGEACSVEQAEALAKRAVNTIEAARARERG